jgi:hypothetical protein
LRYPVDPSASCDPARQAARLEDGTLVAVRIDHDAAGRWARVTVHRDRPPMTHAEAVPLAAEAFLLGRFEPFAVDSVAGADGHTWHYAIDLVRYQRAHAERLLQAARALLSGGSTQDEIHVAARQIACPFPQLAAVADLEKAAAKDARTVSFLSDRFRVPPSWIEATIDDFLVARAEGSIDASGRPLAEGS